MNPNVGPLADAAAAAAGVAALQSAKGKCSVLSREHALVCQTTCTSKATSCHKSGGPRRIFDQKQVDTSACPASSPVGVVVKEHYLPD